MSKAAAETFINAVKATRADFAAQTGAFYKKFIVGKETPTKDDAKKLADIVKKMEETGKAYHTDVFKAIQPFGGISDTEIRNAQILYDTILQKVKK